jgi:hypothetical protein
MGRKAGIRTGLPRRPPCEGALRRMPMTHRERWLRHMESAVCISVDLGISLTRAFQTVFEACESGVRSRRRSADGTLIYMTSDSWIEADIGAYEIRLQDGTLTNFDEIEISGEDLIVWVELRRMLAASSSQKLREAPRELVDREIAAVYDEAEAAGRKPPNIKELPKAVLARLKSNGFHSSQALISELGRSSKHASRRRQPGITLSSERRPGSKNNSDF